MIDPPDTYGGYSFKRGFEMFYIVGTQNLKC